MDFLKKLFKICVVLFSLFLVVCCDGSVMSEEDSSGASMTVYGTMKAKSLSGDSKRYSISKGEVRQSDFEKIREDFDVITGLSFEKVKVISGIFAQGEEDNLAEIQFDKSIERIEKDAFLYALGLKSVRFDGEGDESIGNADIIGALTCIGATGIEGSYTDVSCSAGNKVLNGDVTVVSGTVASYVENGAWSCVHDSVTLYAKWNETSYKIAFDKNGGSGEMSLITTYVGSSVELPNVAFTRTGYTFVNWNTNADGTGTAYVNNSFVKDLATTSGATVTLYAQWKANRYTILLKDKDGIAQGTAVAEYDNPTLISFSATTTAGGKTFDGFFTRLNAGADGDRCVIDRTGALIADVSGYTDSTGKWICTETGIQLYARWH